MKDFISVVFITIAFALCSISCGIIIGDVKNSAPNNFIYHYQSLIAGILAIAAALIGGWFVIHAAKYPLRFNRKEFIQSEIDKLVAIQVIFASEKDLRKLDHEVKIIAKSIKLDRMNDISPDVSYKAAVLVTDILESPLNWPTKEKIYGDVNALQDDLYKLKNLETF